MIDDHDGTALRRMPKGAEVRYRIWSATPETKKALKN